MNLNRNVLYALLAALLFGASTPFAKAVLGSHSPLLVGGVMYLGSGLGLGLARLVRDRGWAPSGIETGQWRWLIGAIFFGGVLGPVALLLGLAHTSASTASLLLNLEAVLTALIAWTVFRENADHRVVLGMVLVVLGGAVLSWQTAEELKSADWIGPAAIIAACVCWAIDNNLTRKVSASDALFIAASKGLIAGVVNTMLALFLGAAFSNTSTLIATMFVGLLGYGLSLVLFVLALRGLGAARTGAYFSTAPFIGAAIAFVLFGETSTPQFWLAAGLMGAGVWLHLTEHHNHDHTHESLAHAHRHTHDAHHTHPHAFEWDGDQPHSHWHEHTVLRHKHPHFPDIHHQHMH